MSPAPMKLEEWLQSRWVHVCLLIAVAWFAFFHNLDISLFEGSEGLYAGITHEMVERGDYVHLTYQREAYANKSPFFFWVLAFSTSLFGENEIALRLPGSLFSIGTMFLTYALGAILFSQVAAFWAALVVATTHVFLWYGRRVLFDSMLVFFMTLALLLWARAYFQQAGHRWYALSCLPMALATMTKGLHGIALPLLVITAFLLLRRDAEPLKARAFWIGLLSSLAIIWLYAFATDLDPVGHSLTGKSSIVSLTTPPGGHPIYWYLGVMWFDFFPWCALIPPGLILLCSRTPLAKASSQVFVLTWFVGLFVLFSLSPLKRETYLMPMVPPLALLVGYCCHVMWFWSNEKPIVRRTLSLMLAVLAVAYILAVTHGPELLHRKWKVPLDLFPHWFTFSMIVLGLALLYGGIRMQSHFALTTLALSSIAFMVCVVHLILPAIDQTTSARLASLQIKSLAQRNGDPVHLYSRGWPNNEDAIYYLTLEPALPRIWSEQSLKEAVRTSGKIVFVTDKGGLSTLSQREELHFTMLQEFPQWRNKNLYLLSAGR